MRSTLFCQLTVILSSITSVTPLGPLDDSKNFVSGLQESTDISPDPSLVFPPAETSHLLLQTINRAWRTNPPETPFTSKFYNDDVYPIRIGFLLEQYPQHTFDSLLPGFVAIRVLERKLGLPRSVGIEQWRMPNLDFFVKDSASRAGRVFYGMRSLGTNATSMPSTTLIATSTNNSNQTTQLSTNDIHHPVRLAKVQRKDPVLPRTYITLIHNALKTTIWIHPATRAFDKEFTRLKIERIGVAENLSLYIQLKSRSQNGREITYEDVSHALIALLTDPEYFEFMTLTASVYYVNTPGVRYEMSFMKIWITEGVPIVNAMGDEAAGSSIDGGNGTAQGAGALTTGPDTGLRGSETVEIS